MGQLSLLADTPIARRRDPETSKAAALAITVSGKRGQQQGIVLDAVKKWPGLTSAELAARMKCSRFMPARRLPELRTQGLAENGKPRECEVTEKLGLTWWPFGTAPRNA